MTLKRVLTGRITPPGTQIPPVPVLWWPLDTAGAVTAGTTCGAGLTDLGQDGNSIATDAVLQVNAAGATWNPRGGLTHTAGSAAYWDIVPTSDDLTFAQGMLDLSNFAEGECLVMGCEIVTPAGWTTPGDPNDHEFSSVCLCIGDLSAGNGGYSFEISGVERPQITFWGQGASAQAAVLSTTGSNFLRAGNRNVVVFELIRAATPSHFIVRAHVISDDEGYSATGYTAERDFSDAVNSGTAAPGCGTAGLRIARRRSATSGQTNRGETLRNVWIARFPSQMFSFPKRCALEMYAYPNRLPPALRRFENDQTIYQGPDGNADKTFGEISLADMFVYVDGATPFASTPELTMEVEQPVTPSISKLSAISAHPNYSSDSTFEGLLRQNPALGGPKFGRYKTGTWANTLIFSAHKEDISNRGRCEITWQGPPVTMPLGVTFWMAERVYLDFPPPDVGQLVIMQLFPGYFAGSGLFPMWTLELDTTNKRLYCKFSQSDQPDTVQADIVRNDVYMPGYSDDLFQGWHDIVVQHRVHWDATEGPFTRIWLDGVQILEHAQAYGYPGPAGLTGKSTDPFLRCGIYPPSPYITPNTTRDVRVARFFGCKNVGNYNEPLIRAALTA
ncbi:hypothetical protein [Rubrivivax albus]|uniref:Uncharacterized protein n=1 Tax=Rubrivivax albus TaxID=2499835 RepID=A0A3S2TMT7_9BURK|nr:hypothetical protein [Rubrivivax albus]RVT48392.1 hypothetical protein ENE75_22105 [Rubrivivax albus]